MGSTQHLKNLYGAGYTLEVKLKHIEYTYLGTPMENNSSSDHDQIINDLTILQEERIQALKLFVNDLFPDATLDEIFADRLVYSVPQHAVSSLAECFSRLEKGKTSDFSFQTFSYLCSFNFFILNQ